MWKASFLYQYSDYLPFLSGIPQGSTLGLLLFIAFITDLPVHVLSSLLLFADDTKCFKTIADINDSLDLQKDGDILRYGWSINTNLLFNCYKILFMSFKSQLTTSYSIGNNTISKVSTHKHLGIIISSDLDWQSHHQHIISNAYRMLGLLWCSFTTSITTTSKKQLYTITG